MELVRGVAITRYCDDHRLGLRDRLTLFVGVCRAVQHAHQKGIIHRDLKPSNVLIAEYDGKPAAKVIDFGVAKPIDRASAAETEVGVLVGTPESMSPEQADLSANDIDTRTDVYALGGLLYELLTGDTPFERARLRGAGVFEVLRIVREEEPPPPSSRLAPAAAKAIRGDLDWITLKALEKDRARRYETAAAFADDIERHLNTEPVQAGPPGARYRLAKFVRRHAAGVAAAALVLAALLAGTTGTAIGMVKARAAEVRAGEHLATAVAEKSAAQEERDAAKAVTDFLTDELLHNASAIRQARTGIAFDPDVKLRTVLDRAAERVERKFEKKPRVEFAVRNALGKTYFDLTAYEPAYRHMQRADELARQLYVWPSPERLAVLSVLGQIHDAREDFDRAEAAHRQLVEGRTQLYGPGDRRTLQARALLADIPRRRGRPKLAETQLEAAYADCLRELGPDHEATYMVGHTLGVVCMETGHRKRAAEVLTPTYEGRQKMFGPDHPATLVTLNALATLAKAQRDFAKAEPLFLRLVEARRKINGPDHAHTLSAISNLGDLYIQTRRLDQAEQQFALSLERRRATLGPEHEDTLVSMTNLASVHQVKKRFDLAQQMFEQIYAVRLAKLGPKHPLTIGSAYRVAAMAVERKQFAAAEAMLREAQANLRQMDAPPIDLRQAIAGKVGECLTGQGKFAEAEAVLRECLADVESSPPTQVPRATVQGLLGVALLEQKRYADAEPLLVASATGARGAAAATAARRLVRLYDAWGKPDEAAKWRAKLPPPPR